MVDVLLVGESWTTVEFEIKGRNVIRDSQYSETADRFVRTLEAVGMSVTYQPCHVAVESFPRTNETLDQYDLVILSDIGADTLQITDRVAAGDADIDRCTLLADWVREGGAIGMVGGYMSFSGKGGQARYKSTAIADVLPIEMQRGDDRVETPAGAVPYNEDVPGNDLPTEWPHVLGYNRFTAAPDADVWATVNDDPFLVVGDAGDGGSFAYATDCAPHWAPEGLLEWEHLPTLWERIIDRVI